MIKFTPDYLKTSHRKSRPSRRRRKDWIDDGGPGGDNVIMFTPDYPGRRRRRSGPSMRRRIDR